MKGIPVSILKWPGRWRCLAATALFSILVVFLGLHIAPLFFPLPERLSKQPEPGQCFTDRNGTPLRRLLNQDLAIDSPATLDEIPPHLVAATLAVEDARFWRHQGIDLAGIARAGYDSLRAGRLVSGASTISQQLVKITSPPKPRTLRNKIVEALTARKLELSWSKEEILTAYLNRLPYGNLLTGCRTAARGYFNKPLADLSLAECSLLAGLPNRPSYLNPHRHFEAAKKRQGWVLKRMLKTGNITHQEYQHALSQPLRLQAANASTFEAPHLVDLILATSVPPSQQTAPVQTTIDLPLQHFIEQTIHNQLQQLEQKSGQAFSLQAAAVVLDNATGEVLGLVGSRDYFQSESGQINGAWTPRSPGSALKPFTYLMALQRGDTAATILDDLPLEFMTPTGAYRPVNYDRRFRGPVTLREALATSLNVPAIRTLDHLGGPATLHATLENLGLTTLDKPPASYGLGLTIGTAEVRLLELVNAYACLARLGHYADYRLLSTADPTPLPTRTVFDPEACYILADILSDQQARASAFGLNSPLNLPFKLACKTGTSTDFRDNWTVGFTPEFTVGVWVGCFDNQPMPHISGVVGAGPIFHEIFKQLYSERSIKPSWYPRPRNIVSARIDPLNGKRIPPAQPGSPPFHPRQARTEIFRPSCQPPIASAKDYDSQGRNLLPPRYAAWFASGNHHLRNQASVRPANTAQPDSDTAFEILSPLQDTLIYLDADLPNGGRFFSLLTSSANPGIIWSSPTLQIDTQQSNQPVAILQPGTHQLTATDPATGHHSSVTVKVESL